MSDHLDEPDDYDGLAAQHVSMRRVLALFAPYRKRIAAVMLLMVVASATGLAGPFLPRAISGWRVRSGDTGPTACRR
ncbi:hypothetical protein [Martelella soudanensis]|uniref:hypothetical protein n=1 Tax=unclassified Martelella TaxID=2629616 RepID=UPI0015DF8DC9|nr:MULTISPECIES: hypothetical protein [unclassified Martelella]